MDPSGCVLQPTLHLIEQMNDTRRGFSAKEVEDAVYRGSKDYKAPDKYIGRFGRCEVVVYIRKCHLTVVTPEYA